VEFRLGIARPPIPTHVSRELNVVLVEGFKDNRHVPNPAIEAISGSAIVKEKGTDVSIAV
jgi:hypothetical protein